MRDDENEDLALGVGRVVATILGACVLVATVAFFVRTRPVVGPMLRAELVEWADRQEASLEVGGMRPRGLTGIRLKDVELEVDLRGRDVDLQFDSVDLEPSISELFTGHARLGSVRMAGGEATVALRQSGSAETSERSEPRAAADSSSAASVAGLASPFSERLSVSIRDVECRVRVSPELATAPIEIRRAEVELGSPTPNARIDDIRMSGRLPGRVPFTVSSRHSPSTHSKIHFEAASSVSLETLLDVSLPARLQFRSATACPKCRTPELCLNEVTAERDPNRLEAPEVCLGAGEGQFAATTSEIAWFRRGKQLPLRLLDFETRVGRSMRNVKWSATAGSRGGGRAEIEAHWDRSEGRAEVRLESTGFRPEPLWSAIGVAKYVSGGVFEGRVEAHVDTHSDLVDVSSDMRVRDATIRHSLLARRPVEIARTRVDLRAFSDLAFDHLNLVDTRLKYGGVRPVDFTGSLVDTGRGWAFDWRANGDHLSTSALRDALPQNFSRPARDAQMRGEFRASVSAVGHTSYPESLHLEVDVGGDVRVLRESSRVDVTNLAVSGPPDPAVTSPLAGDLARSDWVAIEQLPEVVPEVVLAAEDTRFYRHRGFDWGGIRNAMAHNLRVGRLERGGSTISQQVAKNLYFSHRRTLSRKIREVWATWRLESKLSKERILELYLNVVEWGPGVRGLRSAAHDYFGNGPEELDIQQATLLSAMLPGPHRFGSLVQRGYLPSSRLEKIEHILTNLRFRGIIGPGAYERMYDEARRGEVGGLSLTVCRDDGGGVVSIPDCPDLSDV